MRQGGGGGGKSTALIQVNMCFDVGFLYGNIRACLFAVY